MDSTLLCLSCLNGQLRAVAFKRGSLVGSWEKPNPVDDFRDFAEIEKEAAEKTGFTGQQAMPPARSA